jgi:hypothetical protein
MVKLVVILVCDHCQDSDFAVVGSELSVLNALVGEVEEEAFRNGYQICWNESLDRYEMVCLTCQLEMERAFDRVN